MLLSACHVPPELEVWEADVPLVLVDVYYEPYGPLRRPVGRGRGRGERGSNIIWLSPVDEASLLQFLADAGVIVRSEAA